MAVWRREAGDTRGRLLIDTVHREDKCATQTLNTCVFKRSHTEVW